MLVRSKLSFERKRAGSVFPYYTMHVVQQITIMIWCGLSACGAHFLVTIPSPAAHIRIANI